MAFEIFTGTHKNPSPRRDEFAHIFASLAADPKLSGRIDAEPSNVYTYAKQLGYKVYVRNEYNGHSIVQVTGRI